MTILAKNIIRSIIIATNYKYSGSNSCNAQKLQFYSSICAKNNKTPIIIENKIMNRIREWCNLAYYWFCDKI